MKDENLKKDYPNVSVFTLKIHDKCYFPLTFFSLTTKYLALKLSWIYICAEYVKQLDENAGGELSANLADMIFLTISFGRKGHLIESKWCYIYIYRDR